MQLIATGLYLILQHDDTMYMRAYDLGDHIFIWYYVREEGFIAVEDDALCINLGAILRQSSDIVDLEGCPTETVMH